MAEIGKIGKLHGSNLPQLLNRVYLAKMSAIIDFQHNEITKSLHLENGSIIFARSNQKSDRLGEFLVNNNFITPEDMKKAANTLVKTGNRLGRILVEMKLITPRDLFTSVRKQIAEIALSIFDWDTGQFRVYDDLKPPEERIVLEMSTPDLVLQGARRHIPEGFDWTTLVSDKAMLSIHEDAFFNKLPFEKDDKIVIDLLQKPLTVPELVSLSPLPEKQTLTIFARLFYLGNVVGLAEKSTLNSPIITETWHWPDDTEDKFLVFNKAYRFIFRFVKIETDRKVQPLLFQALESIKSATAPIFANVQPLEDGTLDFDMLKNNALDVLAEQRLTRLFFGLNEYLYALVFILQKNLPTVYFRQVMLELKSILD